MTFAEVLPALRAGKTIRRASWIAIGGVKGDEHSEHDTLSIGALLASDWELVEEPLHPAEACGIAFRSCREEKDHLRASIASLERERDLLKLTVKTCEEVSSALERELAEANKRDADLRDVIESWGWRVK